MSAEASSTAAQGLLVNSATIRNGLRIHREYM